jgi:hypothetical protein
MKINENDKITLTLGQLKRLIKESRYVGTPLYWESPPDPDPIFDEYNIQTEEDVFNYSMDKSGMIDYESGRFYNPDNKERYERLKEIFMHVVKTGISWKELEKICTDDELDDMDNVGTYGLAKQIHDEGLNKTIDEIYDAEIQARNEI